MLSSSSIVRRRPVIAVVVDYLHGEHQLGLIQGAQEASRLAEVNLLVVAGRALNSPNYLDPAHNEIYSRLGPLSVDGIILGSGCIGNHVGEPGLSEFARRFAGVPLCSASVHLPGIPSVVISNRRGTRAVIDHLIDVHGCRRIAYIRGPSGNVEAQERYDGYLESLVEHRLDIDPGIVEIGDFWINSAVRATSKLLDEKHPFDALVAANDYMALAAIDVMKERGIRLPRDVLTAGFDDIAATRTSSPSLTTVRQPMEVLGRAAVDIILRQMSGQVVNERSEIDVELMKRRSCGCGRRDQRRRGPRSISGPPRTALGKLQDRREHVLTLIEDSVRLPRSDLDNWSERVLRALQDELSGAAGRFLLELEDVLDEVPPNSVAVEDFNGLIGALRAFFSGTSIGAGDENSLDELWHSAVIAVAAATTRSHVRQRITAEDAQDVLRTYLVDRLSASLSHEVLAQVLREMLPLASIPSAIVSLYEDDTRATLRPLLALRASGESNYTPYPANELVPAGFFPTDRPWTYVLLPLTSDKEQLGLTLLEAGGDPVVYRQLRGQISAAVKGAALHRAILQQNALREQAEREQLHKEALIARQIQTAILPATLAVAGLELAAVMLPAASVGGDYYDVLPTEDGCWIGVGDVTGHGLLAGILMLMIQSMIAGIQRMNPRARPAEVIMALNAALFQNVRYRLKRDDYATLTLFRYERSGRLTFAGCHEDFLVCRARSRRCEPVPTPGVWTGAMDDVSELTQDAELELADGDLLVLYTDGVTEAMNDRHERFGLDRLAALIEEHQSRDVAEICAAVVAAVTAWAPVQADDVSLVVGRHTAPAKGTSR